MVACVAEVGGSADRVTGEVSRVLYADQIRALRRAGAWPQGFEDDGDGAAAAPSAEVGAEAKAEARQGAGGGGSGSESDDDGLPPLVANTNRAQPGVRPRGDSDDEGDDD